MVKIQICQFPELGAIAIAKFVKIHGAELMSHSRHAGSNINDMQKINLDLGSNDHGTETCNLGTNCYGTEPRVYILKGYLQGCICEYL
jgi:hypothetical protein